MVLQSVKRFLRKHFLRSKPSNSEQSNAKGQHLPPKYTKKTQNPEVLDLDGTPITYKAFPNKEWKQNQCRKWIEEVLVERCEMSRGKARKKAKGFKGYGAGMFAMSSYDWNCPYSDGLGKSGNSIYGLLHPRGF